MGSPAKRLQYTYDVRGNRRSLTDADGGRFTYGYDSRSRITNVRNPQGDRTTFSYNAVSQRTVTRLSNGTRTSFSYDAAGNLTLLSNRKSDGSLISSFQYGYDKTGNRTSVLEGGGSRVTWSYDAGSQLAGEHRTGTTPYRNTFTYDAAGNRTLKNEGGARTTYSYDTANQLQWSQAAAGRTTYTFDADGNQQRVLAPDGSRTTTAWDYENRSTRVQLPSGIRNTMAYEPEGLRVKLEESAGTKKFVWDEQNYLAETDGANDTQVVYTNEPQFYGRLLSQRRGSTPSWYHYDGLGSTRELTDATQAVTDQKLYDAWGSVIQSSGSTVFPFQYVGNVGYYTDADQDTIYIRARTYQPSIARWWSVDPLRLSFFRSADVQSLGQSWEAMYQYVDARPTLLRDAAGLQGEPSRDGTWTNRFDPNWLGSSGCIEYCVSAGIPQRDCIEYCGFNSLPGDWPREPGRPNWTIVWGQEIPLDEDSKKKFPDGLGLDLNAGNKNCACVFPSESRMIPGNQQRPKSKTGKVPTPGYGDIPCERGELRVLQYPGRCVSSNLPKGILPPAGDRCFECFTCQVYVLWTCINDINKPAARNNWQKTKIATTGCKE